jgi:hypothetical protein
MTITSWEGACHESGVNTKEEFAFVHKEKTAPVTAKDYYTFL